MTEAVALGDGDMTGQDNEHAWTGLAGLEQRFTMRVAAHLAEPAHPRDLLRRQRGKCLFMTGNARDDGALPSVPLAVVLSTLIPIPHHHTKNDSCGTLFVRLSVAVMWGDVRAVGRCGAGIASSPRLRFPPLEIFAQRQLQPLLPSILLWILVRWSLA
jgi:hypothetical protein